MQTKLLLQTFAFAALSLAACGDDENGAPDSGVTIPRSDSGVVGRDATPPTDAGSPADAESPGDGGTPPGPPPPTLGTTVIDRMGRAAINTALVSPLADEPDKSAAKDNYNANGNEGAWATAATAELAASLALFDALDALCGNQLLAGISPAAGRYDTLAGILADDRLYVNSRNGVCGQYLAVELSATVDCGGRAPSYDVIDSTYSVMAIGMTQGVEDGVTTNDRPQSDTTFPFFAEPP